MNKVREIIAKISFQKPLSCQVILTNSHAFKFSFKGSCMIMPILTWDNLMLLSANQHSYCIQEFLTLSRIVCLIPSLSSSCFLYFSRLSFSASLIASCLNFSCSCCSSLLVPLPSSLSPPTPGMLSENSQRLSKIVTYFVSSINNPFSLKHKKTYTYVCFSP